MIGRGSYGNPWIFKDIKHYLATGEKPALPDVQERVDICRIHLEKSVSWKGERIALNEIKKHYAEYFKGYPDFKHFKVSLMEAHSLDEVNQLLNEITEVYSNQINSPA
jgi:tRNA-dihydrouridine synthase